MMKTGCLFLLPTLCCVATLLAAPGCSERQLAEIDRAAQDANTVGQGVTALAHGPAASLIPAQVRQIMELLGIGLAGALAVWKWLLASGLLKKNQNLTVTLKAIVDGIEAIGPHADPAKDSIKEIMRDREVYSVANPIIDQLKNQPAGKIS
jgi:hypothetical protein